MSVIANSHVPVHPPIPAGPGGPVLVASDGAAASSEALFNAGRLAAAASESAVEIIGVCEPMPGVATGMEVVPVSTGLNEARRERLQDDLRRSVSIAAAGDPAWPITVLVGSPARTLASEATRRGAAMIVMGLGRHNPLDRLFGTETTLATLRESHVPVLAVGPNFIGAPSHGVVGLDFSAASLRAAQLAARLIASGGLLTLVHVRPRFEHPSADWQAWDAEYSRTLPPLFEQVKQQLELPAGVRVETVTVRGDPAPALLAYAQQTNAELVAVGTQRHSLYERLVVGSVATRILRTARCGVLAVPHREPV